MRKTLNALALGLAVAVAGAGSAVAGDATVGDITIKQPWARASAGRAPNGAAFMSLTNGGTEADRLVAASADIAKKAELHTHIKDGEVMKMRPVEAIEVPAGQTVTLQPGGLHVMFMGLHQPLQQGGRFPLTLEFAKAGKVIVEVPIQAPGAGMPMAGGMDHGH